MSLSEAIFTTLENMLVFHMFLKAFEYSKNMRVPDLLGVSSLYETLTTPSGDSPWVCAELSVERTTARKCKTAYQRDE